jgi:predicted Zn-dependent peptidase
MPVEPEIGTLANGLRVVTTVVPTSQSVSVSVFVGAGSRGETERTNGVAHFLEHMVFKGTPRRSTAIEVAEAIEGAGGSLNAQTSKELTWYWNHVPFDRLETAVDVLADMLQNSLLSPEEIDRERSVVQQEIRRAQDQPGAWVGELLSRAYYGDHPMGWSVAGTEETVGGLEQRDFKQWIGAWYAAQNMVLSVAGNTTHDDVMALAGQYFESIGTGVAPDMPSLNGSLPSTRTAADARPIAQANVAIGLPGISRKDPDRYALMVLNSILGRGMSSRLFKEVRERRGLAYSVGSSASRYSDVGMVVVSAGVAPENMAEAVKVIFEQLTRIAEELVGEDELARAREYMVGNFRLGLESTMALGHRAGESLLTMGEIEPVESVVAKLSEISAEDVIRVARRLLLLDRAAIAVVGPDVTEAALGDFIGAG